jgi:hypothetical protein
VYRLIQHEPIVGLKKAVLRVIKRDPMVFERHLDQQLEELVLKPLRKVAGRSNPQHWPAVIIVDGLDECQGDGESSGSDSQKEILSALSRACTDPAFPFRIIVASRPEPVIRHFFAASPSPILRIFLDDKYDPDSDIRLFLEAMFSDIRRRFNLPSSWASKDVVDLLVTEASGQFIYAATVVRFLDSPHLGAPQQQLNRVLEWRRRDNSTAFAPLDRLYDRILRTSPEPLLAVKWLRFIDDCSWRDAVYLRCVLESYIGETEHVLGTLTSLIGLGDDNLGGRFHFYHKSLLDFLGDPHRSSDLHINEDNVRHFVQDRYYQFLLGTYSFRVSDFSSHADPTTARGPQSNATSFPLVSRSSDVFCDQLCRNFDPRRKYTLGDAEWWLGNLSANGPNDNIRDMLHSVHQEVCDCGSFISLNASNTDRYRISVQMVSLPSRLWCLEEGYLEILPAAWLAGAYGNGDAMGQVQKKKSSGMICRNSPYAG